MCAASPTGWTSVPLIRAVHDQAEACRAAELARAVQRLFLNGAARAPSGR